MANEHVPVAATRAVTVPAPEDLEHAKDDALLQLRIGRYTHFYTVVISAALALDAILLLYFQPNFRSLAPGSWRTSFYLLLPISAGVMISAVGLASKWEEYQLWPWELHFSASVGALGVNAVILFVFVAHLADYGSFAGLSLWPWYYPIALAGISFALVALVLTWSGWTSRQWASALAAVLPVATALIVVFPPSGTTSLDSALAIGLFISAIFYQTSGSFLHLISSGTRSHERELITSGQSRMFRLADDLREKEEALHFREAALVKREADAENDEMSIERQQNALKEARSQLEGLEQDYQTRSDAVVAKEREWAGKIAEMDARTRLVDDKAKAVELREQEVTRALPLVSAREQRLIEREGELTKRDVELTQRQQDLDRRTASLPEAESRLDARRKDLDQKTNELLRREGAVSALESGGRPDARSAGGTAEVASREVKLQQLKLVLDEQNVVLGRKAKETAERARTVEMALRASASKEADLATREASLRQRESDLADRLKAADERRGRYDTAARDYESRLAEVGKSQAEAAQKAADVERTMKTVTDREAVLQDREKRARQALADVEGRERAVNARERALSASEAELGLRRQVAARATDRAPIGPTATSGQMASVALPLVGLARPGDPGVRDVSGIGPTPAEEGTLRAPVQRRLADRLPTGTARLDDLLLGGFPPKSHVVLLGDAFVGKEVVLYAFIAEGLKRGEPAVVVTASRTPNEVAESLGVVLPQFHEYEQMGMVTWVDASGPAAKAASSPHRFVARGSDDRAGILSLLVKAAKAAEGEKQAPFRVGFLGLAAVLAHGDERASFSFLQNVVGILKPRNAITTYSLEGAALSDAQVETLLSRMDGALVFRQDRDKTFLSVKGLGEVQTRDWVECRATNRALILGSFALERIR